MENNKKILVPTIVAVVTLILLVVGATYAYFTVGSTNNFGTKELNASLEDMADAVVLEQLENELSLNVTRAQMSEDNTYTWYYASGSAKPARIAKMSVAGDGVYKCDYKVTVTKSASSPDNDLYNAYTNNSEKNDREIAFYLNDNEYDFYEDDLFPITYTDTMYNITKDTPKYIRSNLEIVNQEFEQDYLKGKDIKLTYTIEDFECELSESTGQYRNLTFNYEYLDDLGYFEVYDVTLDEFFHSDDGKYVIPETFQGKDGVWYRVTGLDVLAGDFPPRDITSIELPDSITVLGDDALYGLEVETIKMPRHVVSVGMSVFAENLSLRNLYIPKSLQNVEAGFFNGLLENLDFLNIYYEGSQAEWNALFSKYIGDDKDYQSIIGYLLDIPEEAIIGEGFKLPPINFNTSY